MTDEDIRKLLGGYATDTLSEAEQKALFEAALHDEKLFAALAGEQALREMLSDPGHRAAVLGALEPKRPRWLRWMMPVGAAASLVVIVSAFFVLRRPAERAPVEIAQVSKALGEQRKFEAQVAAAPVPAASAPAPVPVRDRRKIMERAVAPATPAAPSQSQAQMESVEVRAAAPLPSVVTGSGSVAGQLLSTRAATGLDANASKFRYSILKRGPDGQFQPVDRASIFQPSDELRLSVDAEEPGVLAVSQKEPPKTLFQGVVQKQTSVVVPATGSLDLSNRGGFQIAFREQGSLGGYQNALMPAVKRKDAGAADTQAGGAITVDVILNVAAPVQQQK